MQGSQVVAAERGVLGWLAVLARLLTGGVWVWAGADKIGHPYESVLAVRSYEILPSSMAEIVGHTLPTLEIVIGLALITGLLTRVVGVVSTGLYVAFILGIASVWSRGILIDCGCFGGGGFDPDAASKYPWEIARDVALGLLSIFIAVAGNQKWALDRLLFRPSPADRDVQLELLDEESVPHHPKEP